MLRANATITYLAAATLLLGCPSSTDDDDIANDDDVANDDDAANDDDSAAGCRSFIGFVELGDEAPQPPPNLFGLIFIVPGGSLDADGFPTSGQNTQIWPPFGVIAGIDPYYFGCEEPGPTTFVGILDGDQDGAYCTAGDYFGAIEFNLPPGTDNFGPPLLRLETQVGSRTCPWGVGA